MLNSCERRPAVTIHRASRASMPRAVLAFPPIRTGCEYINSTPNESPQFEAEQCRVPSQSYAALNVIHGLRPLPCYRPGMTCPARDDRQSVTRCQEFRTLQNGPQRLAETRSHPDDPQRRFPGRKSETGTFSLLRGVGARRAWRRMQRGEDLSTVPNDERPMRSERLRGRRGSRATRAGRRPANIVEIAVPAVNDARESSG